MRNLLITTALLQTFLILSGCATVEIKDETWYADKGLLGAVELHTETTQEVDIPKSQWDSLRFGMLCTTTDTFAEIKSELEKLCSYGNDCTYQFPASSVNAFIDKMNAIMDRVEKIKNQN